MFQSIKYQIIAILFLSLIYSCSKTGDEILSPPPGNNADTAVYLQFKATGLQLSGSRHYAIISVENKAGQVVFNNKKITLDEIQGAYKTDRVQVNKGEYRLTKFIVVKASDTAIYATPLANSARASQVSGPLSLDLGAKEYGINLFTTEVIKINGDDTPASFGYGISDFGFFPYLTLKFKLKIMVGEIVYDSLPGKLVVDAVDNNNNNHWIREIDLQKGITDIRVPESFTHYTFRINKWNTAAQADYTRATLTNNFQVDLESSRLPKKLITETSYLELSTGYQDDSRTEYFYGPGNRLSGTRYYQRLPQYATIQLSQVYKFGYSGNMPDSIKRFSPDNVLTGFTAFDYAGGKITAMHNRSYDQETFAAVQYGGTLSKPEVTIDYLFSNGNSMVYRMQYRDGNKISDHAQTSTGGSQSAVYEYDTNINPYYHLGYPDIFFTHTSKNNRAMDQSSYAGAFPVAVPYKYEYIYDEDGCPSVLFTSYKGFSSGQHLYRIKKVFQYQQ